jgi:putative ABC transport system ATP-binding protein
MTITADSEDTTRKRTESGDRSRGVAVQCTGLVKVYDTGRARVRAIDGVSLAFEAGRFTSIMGPSGSGKSTLMHCLAGLDRVTSGSVWLGHLMLSSLSDHDLTRVRRERVGFVFQSFNLVPMLTAKQNILLPFELAGREPDWSWFDAVVGVLGVADRLEHRSAHLSGGERQRVAIARALVTRPTVIFADEPTGNLDSATGAELLGFLRMSVDELGQTVLMVTHDPVAAGFSDRVVLLADGKVRGEVCQPTPASVIEAMQGRG